MAKRAVGRALIPVLARLAVHAAGVITGLVLVTAGANGFGNVRGVRNFLVAFVAGVARKAGMSALLQLLALIVAGDALSGLGRLRAPRWSRHSKQENQGRRTELKVREGSARHGSKPQVAGSNPSLVGVGHQQQQTINGGDHRQKLAPFINVL